MNDNKYLRCESFHCGTPTLHILTRQLSYNLHIYTCSACGRTKEVRS